MAVTAIKTGARLPIRVYPKGVRPPRREQQRVEYVPRELWFVHHVKHVRIPLINLPTIPECNVLAEPEVFEEVYSLTR
jgi:hypothetical protein